jgi:hypothetical protein
MAIGAGNSYTLARNVEWTSREWGERGLGPDAHVRALEGDGRGAGSGRQGKEGSWNAWGAWDVLLNGVTA